MTTATTSAGGKTHVAVAQKTITFERTFDAPRELLFRAWSDSAHLRHWWGPKNWTLPVSDMDFRPGGSWRYCMAGPDGTEAWGQGEYLEIVPPQRIVYIDTFIDAAGNRVEGMPVLTTTVEFVERGGKTTMYLRAEAATEAEVQQLVAIGMEPGMIETLDRLEEYLATKGISMSSAKSTINLPSDKEISMSRVMNAPRELIFKAYTDPKHFAQWWGLRNNTSIIDKFDVRPGGQWRVIQRDPQGNENAFRGEFREVVPPTRLVNTFEWEGLPGHIVVDALELTDLGGGKTRITTTSTFASQEDRDGMLASGMEGGANESWDQLEELLAREMA